MGIPNYDVLTEGEKFLIKWQYFRGSFGGFWGALVDAMTVADTENLDKLEKAFPEEVGAIKRFRFERGYWQKVQRKAGMI